MSAQGLEPLDPRMQSALEELWALISRHYPGASFEVARDADEPENVDLITTVDLDDPDEVLDLVIDRLLDLQVEERIPVHVIPIRTPERVLADLLGQARARHRLHRKVASSAAR